MAKYRKRPVVIEAEQWLGTQESWDAIMAMGEVPWKPGPMGCDSFLIHTLEGDHLASNGDWIIKGVNGEFYPCKPDIFQKTYEEAEEWTARGEGWFAGTCTNCGGPVMHRQGKPGEFDHDCEQHVEVMA